MVYTISSHEPFDVPRFSRIKGSGAQEKYLNSVAYSDSCLGLFLSGLKQSPAWKHTLVIVTADHTSLYPGPTGISDLKTYQIPMLWVGGAVDTVMVNPRLCMQTDLSSTLVQQMGWKPRPSAFSKNAFGSKQYAFFFREDSWGYLTPQMGCFQNLESGQLRYYYGATHPKRDSLLRFGQAFTQYLHDDFLKR